VDSSQASAVLENGVLKLTLPLLSESRARGRKIPIREKEKTVSNLVMSEAPQSPKMSEKEFEAVLKFSDDALDISGDEVLTPEPSGVSESKDQKKEQEEHQKGHDEVNTKTKPKNRAKLFPASDLIFAKASELVHDSSEGKEEMPKLEKVEPRSETKEKGEDVTQPSDTAAESRSKLTPEESIKETPKEEQVQIDTSTAPPASGVIEEAEKLWPPISEKPGQSPEAKESHTEELKAKEFTAVKTRRSKSEPPQPSTSV